MVEDDLLNEIVGAIYSIGQIGETDFARAVDVLNQIDDIYHSNPVYEALKLGLLVDLSVQHHEVDTLQSAVDAMERLVQAHAEGSTEVLVFELRYYLGTAYQAQSAMTEATLIPSERQLLQHAKREFKACFQHVIKAVFPQLIPRTYVNYGNLLSNLGRHFEALLAYDAALRLDPSLSMALGNKAIELEHFAWMTGSHELLTSVEALDLAQLASAMHDTLGHGYSSAVESFQRCAQRIADRLAGIDFDIAAAREHLEPLPQEVVDPYHTFITEHGLYLNVCVHSWSCSTKSLDSLFFDYTTPLKADGVFESRARLFNEAKEAFATARYLAFMSAAEMEFYSADSKLTLYADLLEYANYGLKAGTLKAAFLGAFGVLDKIGSFLNIELEVGLKADSVYFDKVLWSDMKNFKLRQQVRGQDDVNLVALSDLARDLMGSEASMKAIRHQIAHRHLVVHHLDMMVGAGSSEEYHIRYDELFGRMLELLKHIKAAMIYLASYLHQKERTLVRHTEGFTAPLFVLWQDEDLYDRDIDNPHR